MIFTISNHCIPRMWFNEFVTFQVKIKSLMTPQSYARTLKLPIFGEVGYIWPAKNVFSPCGKIGEFLEDVPNILINISQ